tara:strand:- start:721 stop:1038 length:318 start_codon:yes stop_codon:yes gene_type:complete
LKQNLLTEDNPIIVFVHQCLDNASSYGVKNAPEVCKVLEKLQQAFTSFRARHHPIKYQVIGEVHYYATVTIVERYFESGNGCSTASVFAGKTIRSTGSHKQASYP